MPRVIARDIDTCGLSYDQIQELWLGCSHNGSLFSSREELQEAWEAARDEVMRLFANNGRRPMAWWQFDAPDLDLKWPGHDREQSYLFEAGALSESECAELVRSWRREYALGHRAGIPDSLRRQWQAERKQHRGAAPLTQTAQNAPAEPAAAPLNESG
jgi:hypothetical protein